MQSEIVFVSITPPAPTTFASKCSPPTPTHCLSANGVSWLPPCFKTDGRQMIAPAAAMRNVVEKRAKYEWAGRPPRALRLNEDPAHRNQRQPVMSRITP